MTTESDSQRLVYLKGLCLEKAKEILDYNPQTGIFTWKVRVSNSVKPGMIAGCKKPGGYIIIVYRSWEYQAHSLAWFYMTGEVIMPDHKNRIRHDNRFENLRPANYSQNGGNRRCSNALGVKGVTQKGSKYIAQITKNYVHHYLGSYDTITEAKSAYDKAAREFYGEFFFA